MRRVTTLFLLLTALTAIHPAASQADTAAGKPPYTDSLMIDLVPTIVNAVSGTVVLDIEAQTAVDSRWSVFFSYETGTIGDRTMFDLEIGPQFRPWGGYLSGAYVGIYPGVGNFSTITEAAWIAGLSAEIGWELIIGPGIVLGASAGASWYSGATALSGFLGTVSLHAGYAFSVPKLHGE